MPSSRASIGWFACSRSLGQSIIEVKYSEILPYREARWIGSRLGVPRLTVAERLAVRSSRLAVCSRRLTVHCRRLAVCGLLAISSLIWYWGWLGLGKAGELRSRLAIRCCLWVSSGLSIGSRLRSRILS